MAIRTVAARRLAMLGSSPSGLTCGGSSAE